MTEQPAQSCLLRTSYRLSGSAGEASTLLPVERKTIGALIHGRIALVGTDLYAAERTVIDAVTVMLALSDSAFNALVCFAVHNHDLLFDHRHSICNQKGGHSCQYLVFK